MATLRVLVVDDEEEFVNALVERLEIRGVDAQGVTNGEEALEHIKKHTYDVVLLDVKMPKLGGVDVLMQIRARWPELQVVLLTGHGSTQNAEMGARLGAFDCLMKPIDIEDLIRVLRLAAINNEENDPT